MAPNPVVKVPNESNDHYIAVSRVVTIGQLLLAFVMLLLVTKVQSVAFLTFAIGSGAGLVYLLRWYWWRVNAWSEIAAMVAGLINLIVFRLWIYPTEAAFNARGIDILLWSLAIVTPAWLLVTVLTRPTDRAQLERFYRKVRPAGAGWGSIARTVRDEDGPAAGEAGYSIPRSLVSWISATLMVYAVLFGTGKLLLGNPAVAAGLWAGAAICFAVLYVSMRAARRDEAPPMPAGEVASPAR